MRNFEERKTEIFSRSEERLKRRKRFCKAASLCCMLLIVALSSTLLLPATMLAKSSGNAAPEAAGWYTIAEQPHLFAAVEVSSFSGNHTHRIEDPTSIESIAELLPSGFYTDGTVKPQSPPVSQDPPNGGAEGYRIALIATDGSEIVYTLTGSRLTDIATGAAWDLDDVWLLRLQALLGLPE